MDACQFFSFLYGPKRARAELSRCFANIGQNLSPKKVPKQSGGAKNTCGDQIEQSKTTASSSSSTNDDKQTKSARNNEPLGWNGSQEVPVSPLRQLRMKINCYASGLASTVKASKASSANNKSYIDGDDDDDVTNNNKPTFSTISTETITKPNDKATTTTTTSTGPPPRMRVRNLRQCQHKSQPVSSMHEHHQDQQLSGTYRAHLIKSLSFDEFGEVKIYDVIDGIDASALENRKSAHLRQQVARQDKQLSSQELEPVDFEPLEEDLREQGFEHDLASLDSFERNDSINNNNNNDSQGATIERVVLYSDSCSQKSDTDDLQPAIISSAEVYNIQVSQSEPGNNQTCQLRRVRSLSVQDEAADKTRPPQAGRQIRKASDQGLRIGPAAAKRGAYIRSLIHSFEHGEAPNHSADDDDDGEHHAEGRSFVTPFACKSDNPTTTTTDLRAAQHVSVVDTTTIGLQRQLANLATKPVSLVKPLPPKTPPKTNKAKCLTIQLSLNKPDKLEQLFGDEQFLKRFFHHLEPLDRCQAAQVCRKWRQVLYSNAAYWKEHLCAIDYTQLRREYLLECIVNTIQSAKLHLLKEQFGSMVAGANNYSSTTSSSGYRSCGSNAMRQSLRSRFNLLPSELASNVCCAARPVTIATEQPDGCSYGGEPASASAAMPCIRSNRASDDATLYSVDSISLYDIDQDDIWRIQELCQRFTQRSGPGHGTNATLSRCDTLTLAPTDNGQSDVSSAANTTQVESVSHSTEQQQQQPHQQQQQQQQPSQIHSQASQCTASQSSSIPSQISSTLSSISLSSIMSALTEMSRTEIIRDKLYESIEMRGIDAITLIGATNEDATDLVRQLTAESLLKMSILRLNNCFLDDTGVERLLESLDQINELELTSCNEITNNVGLSNLKRVNLLTITDCINISDGIALKIADVFHLLDGLVIQAYHLSDCFTDYLGVHCDASKLKRLELQNCKSTTNSSLISVVRHYKNLENLSVSGSKVDDEGIEILTGGSEKIVNLDISWCPSLTDVSLECIACDLTDCLLELKIDRNVHITDHGLVYLTRMRRLKLLYVRWCPRITDTGLEAILKISSLRNLSLAGLQQLTTRALCSLTATNLIELELTNCPSVTNDLKKFLLDRMPNCNITF